MSTDTHNFLGVLLLVVFFFFLVLLLGNKVEVEENNELKASCEKTEMVIIGKGKVRSVYDCSSVEGKL